MGLVCLLKASQDYLFKGLNSLVTMARGQEVHISLLEVEMVRLYVLRSVDKTNLPSSGPL